MDYQKSTPPAYGGHQQPAMPYGGHQQLAMPHGGHQQPVMPHGGHQQPAMPYGGHQQLAMPYGGHQQPAMPHGGHQQPAMPHGGVPGTWSSGICDCFSDVPNCCLTICCPCITFGQIAEIVDKGSTSCGASGALYTLIQILTGCGCIYSCFYRKKMRKQYMLEESPCGDCLVHCCCESCALCQEYRELKHRGFDMGLGWQGNVDKQNQGGMMAPPVAQGGMYN